MRHPAQAATSERGSCGLVFELGLDSGTGVWGNIGLHHTPADFARSVVEALSNRMAVEAVMGCEATGVSSKRKENLSLSPAGSGCHE
jgi:hypothetical protein